MPKYSKRVKGIYVIKGEKFNLIEYEKMLKLLGAGQYRFKQRKANKQKIILRDYKYYTDKEDTKRTYIYLKNKNIKTVCKNRRRKHPIVPEPSTLLLFGIGITGILLKSKRRK